MIDESELCIHDIYPMSSCTRCNGRDAAAEKRAAAIVKGGRRPSKPIEHGEPRGYGQHRAAGTPPCDDCKAAHAKHTALTRKTRSKETAQ